MKEVGKPPQTAKKRKPRKQHVPHPEHERKLLGQSLARARSGTGLSLDGVAKALTQEGFDISKAGVGHWETGQNVIDGIWVRRLTKLYGTTADVLIGNDTAVQWPFSRQLRALVTELDDEALRSLEVSMWVHLRADHEMPESLLRQKDDASGRQHSSPASDVTSSNTNGGIRKHIRTPSLDAAFIKESVPPRTGKMKGR